MYQGSGLFPRENKSVYARGQAQTTRDPFEAAFCLTVFRDVHRVSEIFAEGDVADVVTTFV